MKISVSAKFRSEKISGDPAQKKSQFEHLFEQAPLD